MSEEDGSAKPGRFDEAMSVKGGATSKATRERQRRIRLNDSFMELAKSLDPGKTPKTDKASIVADAIRVVTQLRTENSQLQQLNKFLEERVSTFEKARSDVMMRQAMYQGLNQPSYMQPQMMQGHMGMEQPVPNNVVMGQPVQGIPLQQQPNQQLNQAVVGVPQPQPECSSSRIEVKGENNVAGRGGPGYFQPPSAMGQLSELLNSDQGIFDWALGEGGSPGEQAWMHLTGETPPDTTQDSLKRPPAA